VSRMSGYSHKYWTCPFFKWDEPLCVHCEGGKQQFPDKMAAQEYAEKYCANLEGWQHCTIAANLMRYYERQEAK